VVGDLQQVDVRQVVLQERRIDPFLDIAHQQEATRRDLAEQDDRDVVDARPTVRRSQRYLSTDRPQDLERDLVDRQSVAGGQARPCRRADRRQRALPCGIAGARADHPRLEDASHVISRQQQGEPGDMVLVGVRQDDRVDPAIPWRDPLVEVDKESIWIRATVDQEPPAARAFDQDCIALTDIHDRDPGDPGGSSSHDAACHRDGDDQRPDGGALGRSTGGREGSGGRRPGLEACRGSWRGMRASARPRHGQQPARRDGRRQEIERRLERDARERQARSGLHDGDEKTEDHPAGRGQDGPDDGRSSRHDERAASQRNDTDRHGRCDEGHDDQVDERREDRQSPERHEDDRQRGGLRRERDPEALGEPVGEAPAAASLEPVGERCCPCDQPRGRE
jgi:hypothetical protein